MKGTLGEQIAAVYSKYTIDGLPPAEVEKIVKDLLGQEWVKQLMIFSDQAIFITDIKQLKYLYVGAGIENITGYPASEFPDITSLAKVFAPKELETVVHVSGLFIKTVTSLAYPTERMERLRFTRNNWATRKNGTLVNILQQSMAMAYNATGAPALELLVATDITAFNNSPNHFYRITEVKQDGSELVILQGTVEDDAITPRERQLFSLLAQGNTSEEIAKQLNISVDTVRAHRKHLLEKTRSENRIDLLRYGYAQGWI